MNRQRLHKAFIFRWLRAMFVVLLCCFVFAPTEVSAQRNFSDELDNCSEGSPIEIGTAEDLENFSIALDSKLSSCIDEWVALPVPYVSITDDIDMKGYDNFVPFGYSAVKKLYFDVITIYVEGNNHKISNLVLNIEDNTYHSVGFVSCLRDGYVKNLTLDNANFSISGSELFSCGVLIGVFQGGVVEHCSVTNSVLNVSCDNIYFGVGGAIGSIYTLDGGFEFVDRYISDIISECEIKVNKRYDCPYKLEFDGITSANYNIGGVIGYICDMEFNAFSPIIPIVVNKLMSLKKSSIKISVPNNSNVIGGVIGLVKKENAPTIISISDLYNYSNIDLQNSQVVGGVIGAVQSNTSTYIDLQNMYNAGNISADKYVGGIIGISIGGYINNCVNTGTVSGGYDLSEYISGIVSYVKLVDCHRTTALSYMSSLVNSGRIANRNKSSQYTSSILGYFAQESQINDEDTYAPIKNVINISDNTKTIGKIDLNVASGKLLINGVYSDTIFNIDDESVAYVNKVNVSDFVGDKLKYSCVNGENVVQLTFGEASTQGIKSPFTYEDGYYPRVGDNDISYVASSPFVLAEGETVNKVSTDFKVKSLGGVKWSSKKGLVYIDGENAVLKGTGYDTLTASLNGVEKKVAIYVEKNVFGGGFGSESSPYLIRSKAHLKELSDSIEASDDGLKGRYFRVVADIKDVDLVVAYRPEKTFSGYIDGENHLIELNIDGDSAYAALFGYASEATIKNLQISGRVEGDTYSAGVVAFALNCTVSYCFNTAKISGATAGGVVGYAKDGVYDNLCNSGSISATDYAGGVMGKATGNSELSNLVNSGYVRGAGNDSYVGGVAGGLDGTGGKGIIANVLMNYGSVCFGKASPIFPIVGNNKLANISNDVFDIQICQNNHIEDLSLGLTGKLLADIPCPDGFVKEDGVYPVPSWVKDMKDWQLLAYPLLLQNGEFASNVETEPKLFTGSVMKGARHIDSTTIHTKVLELQSKKKERVLVEFSIKNSATGMTREVYLELAKNYFNCGNGTESSPYCIETKEDIEILSKLVSGKDLSYAVAKDDNWTKGKYFKQTADIETVMSPIGAGSFGKFQGSYDGGNHTVKLYINSPSSDCVALFARCGEGAAVKNLHITGSVSGKDTVAAIIGSAENMFELTNVSSSANVSGSKFVAGIAGYLNSDELTVDLVANGGKVSAEEDAGGIFAYSNARVYRATNTGSIVSKNKGNVAGIVAKYNGKGISNCNNAGLIIGGTSAGIVANNTVADGIGSVDNCFNYGTILGDKKYGIVSTAFTSSFVDTCVALCGTKYDGYSTKSLIDSTASDEIWNFDSRNKYPYLNFEAAPMKNVSSLASAVALFGGRDRANKVQNEFLLYASDGVEWSARRESKIVEITKDSPKEDVSVYLATPKMKGRDTLVATLGGMERLIPIYVDCVPTETVVELSGCDKVEIYDPSGDSTIVVNTDGKITKTVVYKKAGTFCDSTVVYNIDIHKPITTYIDTAICADGVVVIDSAGIRKQISETCDFRVVDGCDTTIWRIRRIVPEVETTNVEPNCGKVVYDGKIYAESTVLTDTIKSMVCDCDSIYHNIVITVYPEYEIIDTLPYAIDSIIYGGTIYRESTTLTTYDGKSSLGCDSVRKVRIQVVNANVEVDTIYACEQYKDLVNGKSYDNNIVIYDTIQSTVGGTQEVSIKIRDVRVYKNTNKDTTYTDIYGCGWAKVGAVSYSKDTVLYTRIERENKCDSIAVQRVFVHKGAEIVVTDTIYSCGEYLDEKTGKTITESITLCDTVRTADSMCDSIIICRPFVIENTIFEEQKVNGCREAQYVKFSGEIVLDSLSKTFFDTLYSARGCIIKIKEVDMVVANPIDIFFDTLSCSPIEYEGKVYGKGITKFTDTIPNSTGDCDSLIKHIKISVLDKIVSDTLIYGCQSATVDGETFYHPYQEIEKSVGKAKNGVCDSFVLYRIFVLQPMEVNETVKGCGEVVYDGVTYTEDAELVKYLTSKRCDCDSTVYVHIKIGQSDFVEIDTADCGSVLLGDVTYTNDAVVDVSHINSYGCDSIVRYNVHILHPSYETITVEGESFVEYEGVTYRRSQTITHKTVNSVGCDSVVTVNIKINKDLGCPVIVDKFGYVLLCNNNISNEKFEKYQWYKNGLPIEGATKDYYEDMPGVKLEGCYHVAVWNASGREFSSEVYCIDKEREMSLYPNPVPYGENVYIDYEFTTTERKALVVEVYSATGLLLREFRPTSYPIVIESMENIGQYFVVLRLSDEKVLDAKFIVK